MKVSYSRLLKAVAAGLLGLLLGNPGVSWSQQSADRGEKQSDIHGRYTEDWTSLSLAGSDLRPEKPVYGEKDDFPLFTRELIQVKWRRGDPIDLYVIRPKGSARPPVILYLYSYPSDTDRFRNDDYCARLTRDGFAAVGFVSALTGQRYSNRPMKEWFVSELQEALATSVHDVQMILNYLSTRDDLDMSKVGMLGVGSGGSIAILAAATDQRIKALDLLDPWGDWPDWMAKSSIIPEAERPDFVTPEFLKKIAPLDPIEWLSKLKSQHVRIQHVLDDDVTPKMSKARIESVAPAAATVVKYETTGQFLGAVSGGRLFQWVKDMVRPPAKPERVADGGEKSPSALRVIEPGHDD
jgi:pimeloyl-ACP methyl ester carboxylesterase